MSTGTCVTCGGLRKELRNTHAGPKCAQCIRVTQRQKPHFKARQIMGQWN